MNDVASPCQCLDATPTALVKPPVGRVGKLRCHNENRVNPQAARNSRWRFVASLEMSDTSTPIPNGKRTGHATVTEQVRAALPRDDRPTMDADDVCDEAGQAVPQGSEKARPSRRRPGPGGTRIRNEIRTCTMPAACRPATIIACSSVKSLDSWECGNKRYIACQRHNWLPAEKTAESRATLPENRVLQANRDALE